MFSRLAWPQTTYLLHSCPSSLPQGASGRCASAKQRTFWIQQRWHLTQGKGRGVPGRHPREHLIPTVGAGGLQQNMEKLTPGFYRVKENNTKVKMKQSKTKQELYKKMR